MASRRSVTIILTFVIACMMLSGCIDGGSTTESPIEPTATEREEQEPEGMPGPPGPEPGSVHEELELANAIGSPVSCAIDPYFDPTYFLLGLSGVTYGEAPLDPESAGYAYDITFGSTGTDGLLYWYIIEFEKAGQIWFMTGARPYPAGSTHSGMIPEEGTPIRVVMGTCSGALGEATFTSYVPEPEDEEE